MFPPFLSSESFKSWSKYTFEVFPGRLILLQSMTACGPQLQNPIKILQQTSSKFEF